MKTATKKKPLTIEERILILHEEIDALVEKHVDKIKEGHPTIPRGVLAQMAVARADGTVRCKCGVYRHLKKTQGLIDESV
jgi:hypothetical protein